MSVVVNPYLSLSSVADRDQFLSLVRDVAHETQENEPLCLAYCWTRAVAGVGDSPAMLQGLEVYASEEALAVTHRSGVAYKHMREVVAATGLLPYPKGGVPTYHPAGRGFLSKPGVPETVSPEDYFVVLQYAQPDLIQAENVLAEEMETDDSVLAFWAFVPDNSEELAPVTIFARLAGPAYYGAFQEKIEAFE
ncbi:hypothetical protein BJX99DRAFT_253603 [Aspergillus californicus]